MYSKILIIANYSPTYGGNFIESIKTLESKNLWDVAFYDNMEKNQVKFYHIFPMAAEKYDWKNKLSNVYFVDFEMIGDKIRELDCERDTLIYTHFVDYKCILRIKRSTRNCDMLVHLHNTLNVYSGIKGLLKRVLYSYVYRNAKIIGVSDDVVDSVKKNMFRAEKIYSIDNGICFDRLKQRGRDDVIDKSFFNLIIFGNHFFRKGVDFALKAVSQLTDEGLEKIKLNVVCNNREENEQFARKVISDEEFLSDHFQIIPTRNDIATYFEDADMLLSPSREEGLCYTIAEGLWCGIEVVASKCLGQRQNKDDKILWVDDPISVKSSEIVTELCEIIKKYYDEKKHRGNLKPDVNVLQNQRKRIENEYSINKWVESVCSVIKTN